MASQENYHIDREGFVDLAVGEYERISDTIQNLADKALFAGERGSNADKSTSTVLVGAVNEGGYRNLPGLSEKVGNALKNGHSFDLYSAEELFDEGKNSELMLRIYGESGGVLHVQKISENEFVPFWTHNDDVALEAESPFGDHQKLSIADMKALLWALSHTGNDVLDLGLLDAKKTLREVAQQVIGRSAESAKSLYSETVFSTVDFDPVLSSLADDAPGSQLKVTSTIIKDSESVHKYKTEYSLITRHAESAEAPDGNEVPIWITYEFFVRFNEKNHLEYCNAAVEVDFQTPEEALLVPELWLRLERQRQQNGVQSQFYGIMRDALSDLLSR